MSVALRADVPTVELRGRPGLLFRDGGNELTAYVVEGAVGSETLRPLDVVES